MDAAVGPKPPLCLGRRRWLGIAAAGAVAAVAGCGPLGAARPKTAATKIVLDAILDIPASDNLGSLSERNRLYAQVLADFESAHRGITVRVLPYTSTAIIAASIIGGTGPDVFADAAPSYAEYVGQNLLLRLDDYFTRDNINPAIWSSSVMDALKTGNGTYAVSRGLDAYLFALNLTLLDTLGVAYPSTDWTHTEFAALAKAIVSTSNGKHRYGVSFQGGPAGFLETAAQVVAGFGGAVTNGTRTAQTLSSPASLAGMEWLLQDLLLPAVGVETQGSANLYGQTVGIQEIQQVQLLSDYQQWQNTFNWVLYPPPVYPRGRFGGAAANYWAISGTTKHPEESWSLLRWMSTQDAYQRFLMKTFLFPPPLNALLPEWEATAEAVAPGLKNRGLRWFTQSGDNGWGQAEPWFLYANAQALTVDSGLWQKILKGALSAQAGLAQADQQVNAAIQASVGEMPSLASEVAAYQKHSARLKQMFAAASGPTTPGSAGA